MVGFRQLTKRLPYRLQGVHYNKKEHTNYALILGLDTELDFNQNNEGLHFNTPNTQVDDKAFVIKIETK